jgi:glycosyltransferase involved in cell wall biosynthesis
MTVLYLNPGARMGGAETSLVELLAALRAARPDWRLCLWTGEDGPLLEQARGLGVETKVLPLPREIAEAGDSGLAQQNKRWRAATKLLRATLRVNQYGSALAKEARSLCPDIVHATGLKMQLLASLYLTGIAPVIWHIHDYVSWRPVARRLLALLAGRVEGAIVNSISVAEDLLRSCPRLKRSQCIYNAVDAEALRRQVPLDLDAAAGAAPAPPGILRIGLVATYARWKGHLTYLGALERLPRELPWRAYIVGGAIYQTAGSQHEASELQEEISRRELRQRVFLTGFLADRGGIMQALDVIVHASTKPEPFGMVVLEAMACGKAVVASRSGGTLEIYEDEVSGLGHEPGSEADLARQIERLCRDEELRQRLGEEGRKTAAEKFSRARLAQGLLAVYESWGKRA